MGLLREVEMWVSRAIRLRGNTHIVDIVFVSRLPEMIGSRAAVAKLPLQARRVSVTEKGVGLVQQRGIKGFLVACLCGSLSKINSYIPQKTG